MSCLSWIIICVFIIQQASSQGPLTYTSENSPAYYDEESATMQCAFTDLTAEFLGTVTGFGVRYTAGGATSKFGTCSISRSPDGISILADAVDDGVTLANEECVAAYNAMEQNGEGQLRFTMNLKKAGEYFCSMWTASAYEDRVPKLNVEILMVAPTDLTMNVDPVNVYVGNTVSIECVSQGGNPAASIKYGSDEELTEAPTFEATKEHNGKMFWCRDESHPNYMGGDNPVTYQTKTIAVYYLMATKPAVTELKHHPSSTLPLSCDTDEVLPEGVIVSYSWTKGDEDLPEETTRVVLATTNDMLNQTMSEMYECTATANDTNIEDVKMSFNITWDGDSDTPTPIIPTTTEELATSPEPTENKNKITGIKDETKEKEGDPTMIIIIVVVVVTVIILIVVIIIIVVKRRSHSAEVTKDAEQSTPPKAKSDGQGNGEPDETVKEETKLLENQEDSKSKSELPQSEGHIIVQVQDQPS